MRGRPLDPGTLERHLGRPHARRTRAVGRRARGRGPRAGDVRPGPRPPAPDRRRRRGRLPAGRAAQRLPQRAARAAAPARHHPGRPRHGRSRLRPARPARRAAAGLRGRSRRCRPSSATRSSPSTSPGSATPRRRGCSTSARRPSARACIAPAPGWPRRCRKDRGQGLALPGRASLGTSRPPGAAASGPWTRGPERMQVRPSRCQTTARRPSNDVRT